MRSRAPEPPVPPAGEDRGRVIAVQELSRWFETPAGRVTALDSVTLTVDTGCLAVVLGPSGSGKTTLLNLIGALDTPSGGVIDVAGKRLTSLRRAELFAFRRTTVSFVFQAFNLFPELTAVENVRFGAEVAGRGHPGAIAVEMLEAVQLSHRLHHFPHELSGGEQQRVAIARSLATGNPVILADEPTGELDFRTGVQILRLLRSRADSGQTVLVVTHNREISRMADLVVELSDGRMISAHPPGGGPVPANELRW